MLEVRMSFITDDLDPRKDYVIPKHGLVGDSLDMPSIWTIDKIST